MTIAVAILLAVVVSTFTTTLSAALLRRQHVKEREQDREDRRQVAIKVDGTSQIINDKLDTVHILVNSNMTAALQAELDATVREMAMMKEVISLNRAAGREPSKEAVQALELTQDKINELKAKLEDRLRQTHIAELKTEMKEEEKESNG